MPLAREIEFLELPFLTKSTAKFLTLCYFPCRQVFPPDNFKSTIFSLCRFEVEVNF